MALKIPEYPLAGRAKLKDVYAVVMAHVVSREVAGTTIGLQIAYYVDAQVREAEKTRAANIRALQDDRDMKAQALTKLRSTTDGKQADALKAEGELRIAQVTLDAAIKQDADLTPLAVESGTRINYIDAKKMVGEDGSVGLAPIYEWLKTKRFPGAIDA